ncbi:MAG: nucleotide exchange factor GrpE [Planctomycetaceae bacterium]
MAEEKSIKVPVTSDDALPEDETPAIDPETEADLAAAIAERDEAKEKWLRTEAELENYRKRVRKETEQLLRFQSLGFARDLLPALDNLERAVAAAERSGNIEELLEGIRMVVRQFRDIFQSHSVEVIPAAGEPFDPNRHEAVQQVPSADHPPMTVLDVLETGYTLHDRVIRPAKVLVSAAPPEPAEEPDE